MLTDAAMNHYDRLLERNADWAKTMLAQDAQFFAKREQSQAPNHLIIGCSDSRVPLELMTQAMPGEMYVHRNIGNQVWANDMNVQAVVHYAVDVLGVTNVIVCGHSNCGALKAGNAGHTGNEMLDSWLSGIRDTVRSHKEELDQQDGTHGRLHALSRLNVLSQVRTLASTPIVLKSWNRGRRPVLHGWIYNIGNGLIERVVENIDGPDKLASLGT